MIGPGLRSWVPLLSLLAAMGACGEGEGGGAYTSIPEAKAERTLARELCALMLERCGCSKVAFGSQGECTDAHAAELEAPFAEAKAAGLEYHGECMAEHVNLWVETVGCATRSELAEEEVARLAAPPCKVHSGSKQLGDACKPYPQALGDDCDVGLRCSDTCTEVVELAAKVEGDPCDLQTDRCEPGTACLASADDPAGPATCVRLPGEGEPCSVGCDVGLTCDFVEQVCKAPPGEGEPCGSLPSECAEGLWCDTGKCALTLAEGQPCFGDDEACGVGHVCDEAPEGGQDVCRPEEAFVCS